MKNKKKILIYIIFIALFAILVNKGCFPKMVSDKDVRTNFYKNEKYFNELIEMFMEDKNTLEVQIKYKEKSNISKKRHEEYMKIFDKLKVNEIYSMGGKSTGKGFSINYDFYRTMSYYRGYKYYFNPNKIGSYGLFNDLDDYPSLYGKYAVKHLKGNWYTYFFN